MPPSRPTTFIEELNWSIAELAFWLLTITSAMSCMMDASALSHRASWSARPGMERDSSSMEMVGLAIWNTVAVVGSAMAPMGMTSITRAITRATIAGNFFMVSPPVLFSNILDAILGKRLP